MKLKEKKTKPKKAKKVASSFTLDPDVIIKAEGMAEQEGRSVSSLINKLIKEA